MPVTPTTESEEAIIAAIFNLPNWFNTRKEQIAPGIFQEHRTQAVVAAALALQGVGDVPDVWAVTQHLNRGSGANYAHAVTELATPFHTPPWDVADTHLKALRAATLRRQLAAAHQQAADLLASAPLFPAPGEPDVSAQVEELLADAGQLPGKLLQSRHVRDIIPEVYDQIQERAANPGKLAGISTGIRALDVRTAGMMRGQVWVFAGMPGDGKSTLMQNCAETAAYDGWRVRWYPLEMPDHEQTFRLLSSGGGLDNEKLFSGNLTRAELEALKQAQERLKNSPIEIVNVDGATAGDILNDILRSECDIAVVDYLQLMEDDGPKGANREQIIASISRRLKRTAKKSNKVILTGSQLNDHGKLRESRAIGQDADKVFMIEKHPLEGGDGTQHDDTKRILFCEKNRGLKRHWSLPLAFLGNIFQFRELPEI